MALPGCSMCVVYVLWHGGSKHPTADSVNVLERGWSAITSCKLFSASAAASAPVSTFII